MKRKKILFFASTVALIACVCFVLYKFQFKADQANSNIIKNYSTVTYTDFNGNVRTQQSSIIQIAKEIAQVSEAPQQMVLSKSHFSSSWNMSSFPDLNPLTNGELGLNISDGFKVRRYDPNTKSYIKGDDGNIALLPGQGYWLKIDNTDRIDSLHYTLNATSSAEITVAKGWNLLGNPFQADLPLSNLQVKYNNGATSSFVDAISRKEVYGYAWSWEASAKEYNFIAVTPDHYKTSKPKSTFVAPYRAFWLVIRSDNIKSIMMSR